MVVGGPTTLLGLGGVLIVSDPTFDARGSYGYLTKTEDLALTEDRLADANLVLVRSWPYLRPGPPRCCSPRQVAPSVSTPRRRA
ncbi:hypothetical protein ACIQVL_10520 [Streptomyces sp. NPDC090499]|uniref:hypothetical protein n=1 Tax=Streptomyces sp. NPDC090499 TaxID=3365965 RepID=UPI003818A565